MIEEVDKDRMIYMCKKTVENQKILESNAKLWTEFLDNQLKDFVILYNFNFYEVANRFHEFISFPHKYEFNEDEIRRHWAFIHAGRYLKMTVDEDYYDALKVKYKIYLQEKKIEIDQSEIKEKELAQEIQRQKEIDKIKYERYNLITVLPPGEKEEPKKDNEIIKKENETEKEEIEEKVDTNFPKRTIESKKDEIAFDDKDKEEDEVINSLFSNKINTENKIDDINKQHILNKEEDLDDYDNTLFPINTKQSFYNKSNLDFSDTNLTNTNAEMTEEERLAYRKNILSHYKLDKELENTKNMDDYIKEDDKLREQYENLNTYYNFAVKSLNYFIPKFGEGLKLKEEINDGNEIPTQTQTENTQEINEDLDFEKNYITKTSDKINKLFYDSVILNYLY